MCQQFLGTKLQLNYVYLLIFYSKQICVDAHSGDQHSEIVNTNLQRVFLVIT